MNGHISEMVKPNSVYILLLQNYAKRSQVFSFSLPGHCSRYFYLTRPFGYSYVSNHHIIFDSAPTIAQRG